MKKSSWIIILISVIIIGTIFFIDQLNSYHVKYIVDNKVYKVVKETKNTPIKENVTPMKDNYVFIGWYDESGNELNNTDTHSSDVVYYASWAQIITDDTSN